MEQLAESKAPVNRQRRAASRWRWKRLELKKDSWDGCGLRTELPWLFVSIFSKTEKERHRVEQKWTKMKQEKEIENVHFEEQTNGIENKTLPKRNFSYHRNERRSSDWPLQARGRNWRRGKLMSYGSFHRDNCHQSFPFNYRRKFRQSSLQIDSDSLAEERNDTEIDNRWETLGGETQRRRRGWDTPDDGALRH